MPLTDHDKTTATYRMGVVTTIGEFAEKAKIEVSRQFNKFGPQYLDENAWSMVVFEEMGEAVQAINQQDWEQAEKEVTEAATCMMRLLDEIKAIRAGGRIGVTYQRQQ